MTKLQADWLHTPVVKAVVEALGHENVKFVGGAVRDTLLGKPVADIDAATCHEPEKVTELLKAAGIKVIPTGIKHGTVTALLGKEVIEITTLRIDVATDGRHAEVAFTTSWQEDAARRDFTFNALYVSPDGTLFDPFAGIEDLKAGKVRFIGDAAARIKEDALRIMRFFRFYARYGEGEPNSEAMEACAANCKMLAQLSVERVRDELLKILALPQRQLPLDAMIACGVLPQIYGAEFQVMQLQDFLGDEVISGAGVDPLLRFYFLAPLSYGAGAVARKFKLSSKEKRFLVQYELAKKEPFFSCEIEIKRFIYRFGKRVTQAVAIGSDKALYQSVQQICDNWHVPTLPLGGKDLLSEGIEPGPGMGQKLTELEAAWLESDFTLSRRDLLELAR